MTDKASSEQQFSESLLALSDVAHQLGEAARGYRRFCFQELRFSPETAELMAFQYHGVLMARFFGPQPAPTMEPARRAPRTL